MPYVGVRTVLGRQGIGLPAQFATLGRLLSSGVLCELSAAAIEWHDERHKGTRPIHAATGAPSNFSGLLDYVVGAGGCGVDIVGLSVDGT